MLVGIKVTFAVYRPAFGVVVGASKLKVPATFATPPLNTDTLN